MVCSLQQTGEFNLKRSSIRVATEALMPAKIYVCQQCKEAPCVDACAEHALSKFVECVELDRSKCSGCGDCVDACPFDAIHIDVADGLARKCDLCGGVPVCVEHCQKRALSYDQEGR